MQNRRRFNSLDGGFARAERSENEASSASAVPITSLRASSSNPPSSVSSIRSHVNHPLPLARSHPRNRIGAALPRPCVSQSLQSLVRRADIISRVLIKPSIERRGDPSGATRCLKLGASLADNAVIGQVLPEDIFRMRLIRSKFKVIVVSRGEGKGSICKKR